MYLAAKQQISWVVSLWQSPPTFVWPRVPKQRTTTASSSQLERHLTVFCINEIVLGYVVYLVKTNSDRNSKQFQPYCVQKSKIEVFFLTWVKLDNCRGRSLFHQSQEMSTFCSALSQHFSSLEKKSMRQGYWLAFLPFFFPLVVFMFNS